MDPYNFPNDLEEEPQGYIHESDLDVCPACWFTYSHDIGCPAAVVLSYEELDPVRQGLIL